MKLLYTVPIFAVSAQAGIVQFLEYEMEQRFQETDDGFKIDFAPFFAMEVADGGMSGQVRTSANGRDIDVDNWETDSQSVYRQWGNGHGSNWMGNFPMMSEIDTYEYEQTTNVNMSPMDFGLDWEKDVTLNFNNGEEGTVKNKGEISVGMSMQGDKATVNIEADIKQTSRNVDTIEGYQMYDLMAKPWSWKSNGEVNVKSISACGNFMESFSGKPCNVDFKNQVKLGRHTEKFMANLKLAQYAVVLKYGQHKNRMEMIFLRSVDLNDRLSPLSDMQYFELHQSWQAGNWQQTLKNEQSDLLIRLPMCNAIEDNVMPALEAFAAPFINFAEVAMTNMEKIPYIIFYMDDLFATLDNEFDLSEVVAATRIESDWIIDEMDAEPAKLNDIMQAGCVELNNMIVEALQCPELDAGMGDMRAYVREMASSNGADEFQRIFLA